MRFPRSRVFLQAPARGGKCPRIRIESIRTMGRPPSIAPRSRWSLDLDRGADRGVQKVPIRLRVVVRCPPVVKFDLHRERASRLRPNRPIWASRARRLAGDGRRGYGLSHTSSSASPDGPRPAGPICRWRRWRARNGHHKVRDDSAVPSSYHAVLHRGLPPQVPSRGWLPHAPHTGNTAGVWTASRRQERLGRGQRGGPRASPRLPRAVSSAAHAVRDVHDQL